MLSWISWPCAGLCVIRLGIFHCCCGPMPPQNSFPPLQKGGISPGEMSGGFDDASGTEPRRLAGIEDRSPRSPFSYHSHGVIQRRNDEGPHGQHFLTLLAQVPRWKVQWLRSFTSPLRCEVQDDFGDIVKGSHLTCCAVLTRSKGVSGGCGAPKTSPDRRSATGGCKHRKRRSTSFLTTPTGHPEEERRRTSRAAISHAACSSAMLESAVVKFLHLSAMLRGSG